MATTLGLVRHGRAAGHGPDAPLLAEGAAYVTQLGRRLAREGWKPAAAASSPYLRARDTARILLGELASDLVPHRLPELTPDTDPGRALDGLLVIAPAAGRLLVVAHMPLLGRLAAELGCEPMDFYPGTFVEIELAPGGRQGRLLRRIGPEDL